MIDFRSVDSDSVLAIWPRVEGYVKSATDHSNGELTPKMVLSKLLTANMQLVVVVDGEKLIGASITEVAILVDGERVLKIICLGSKDFDLWGEKYVDLHKKWASSMGVNRVQLTGRKGWERKLKSLGWKLTSINMEVEADG